MRAFRKDGRKAFCKKLHSFKKDVLANSVHNGEDGAGKNLVS